MFGTNQLQRHAAGSRKLLLRSALLGLMLPLAACVVPDGGYDQPPQPAYPPPPTATMARRHRHPTPRCIRRKRRSL